jgi:signal transduction histidine kinase
MERLINDLLEYSKAASDSHGIEPVDLNEVVDDIMLSYKDALDEKKAVVHISKLPIVKGIPFQLRQIFDNIISNSLKYHHPERTPDITIKASRVSDEGLAELLTNKQYHKIEVCDNGIGFEQAYAEKIFELFQRLSSVKYSGTGVGLALCKKIAQNHQGTIRARGKLDNGACFEIYLPV